MDAVQTRLGQGIQHRRPELDMSMFEIKKGVTRPAAKRATNDKYPTGQLGVDEFFIVPKAHMNEGETAQKFRNRINQSVRTYKQRRNADAHLEPDYDQETFTPLEFSVILLGAPNKAEGQDWEEGDVGVWRDA
jgi:hypothetical protein